MSPYITSLQQQKYTLTNKITYIHSLLINPTHSQTKKQLQLRKINIPIGERQISILPPPHFAQPLANGSDNIRILHKNKVPARIIDNNKVFVVDNQDEAADVIQTGENIVE